MPEKFNAALSEAAYERLRGLNEEYKLGNNYLLTVLLENLDAIADNFKMHEIFKEFIEEYGAPEGRMKKPDDKVQ